MNLILAIVAMSYNELQRRAEEEEEAAAEDEANFLASCRLMELEERSNSHFSTSSHTDNESADERRTSYRPSIEIGLAGQSLLASLCQNGLIDQHVQSRLNQDQNYFYASVANNRSQSLSVDNYRAVESQQDPAGEPVANSSKQNLSQPKLVSSMTELRRNNSARSSSSAISAFRLLRPQSSSSQNSNLCTIVRSSRDKLSARHLSSGHLMASRTDGSPKRLKSARSSTSSYHDLNSLRQLAALIRIVSDEGQVGAIRDSRWRLKLSPTC